MSGGVDSSVAASLLLEAGYEVTGVFLRMGSAAGGCASPGDADDVRRVADKLGIELLVLEQGEAFERILEYFSGEYARGRTPNPCILCNARIKFARLLELADARGADNVATGHYARRTDVASRPDIARGLASRKDQSYALFALPREHLGRILLPIGELDGKALVRRTARSLGLDVHDKPDSQDACFVAGDSEYAEVLRRRVPQALRPGRIINAAGEVLGQHDGYGRFTIGQRCGLGIAAGAAMYVMHIDPQTATITIGPRAETRRRRLTAAGANWHADVPDEFDATVQIRYNHVGAAARVRLGTPGSFEVLFDQPVSAVTPGQAAVVYDGQRLVGGGWITDPGD